MRCSLPMPRACCGTSTVTTRSTSPRTACADDSPMLVESLAARRTKLEMSLAEPDVRTARFTAETIADGTVIGTCSPWGLDAFSSSATSASTAPAACTQGYGREMVRLPCHYGFRFRVAELASRAVTDAAGFRAGSVSAFLALRRLASSWW